jgi:hypothetical protein
MKPVQTEKEKEPEWRMAFVAHLAKDVREGRGVMNQQPRLDLIAPHRMMPDANRGQGEERENDSPFG